MDKNYRMKISLVISGKNLNLPDITKLLKIQPTETRKMSEIPPQTPLEFRNDIWCFNAEKSDFVTLEMLLSQIMDIFSGKIDILNEIIEKFNANISVSVYTFTDKTNVNLPELVIPHYILAFLGSIKAELNFDIYNF